ncbi:hypothetical protein ACLB2K_040419 [Fragaria x ananassa]
MKNEYEVLIQKISALELESLSIIFGSLSVTLLLKLTNKNPNHHSISHSSHSHTLNPNAIHILIKSPRISGLDVNPTLFFPRISLQNRVEC